MSKADRVLKLPLQANLALCKFQSFFKLYRRGILNSKAVVNVIKDKMGQKNSNKFA
jgi:hypothetical protein